MNNSIATENGLTFTEWNAYNSAYIFSCVITAHCSILTCPYLRASSLPHTTLLRPYLERGRRIPSHSLGAFFWNSMMVQSWFDLLSPKYLAFSMIIWFFCNMLHTVWKCEYFPTHLFYVKSIFKILGVQYIALFAVSEALNFGFGEFQLSKNGKNSSKFKFTASKNG